MKKKKLKFVLDVLDKVSVKHPETADFIVKKIMEVCEREKLPVEEVIYPFFWFGYWLPLRDVCLSLTV